MFTEVETKINSMGTLDIYEQIVFNHISKMFENGHQELVEECLTNHVKFLYSQLM